MSIIIKGDKLVRTEGPGDLHEMAADKRREDVGAKLDEAISNVQADAAVVALLERVQAIAEHPKAPKNFKLGIIAMLGGLIVELTK